MKHTSLILFLLFICNVTIVQGQIKKEKNNKHNFYQESIRLDLDRSDIAFNFIWFEDYKNGIGGYGSKYATHGRIISTTDWKLTCKAESNFNHDYYRKKISLNNVGYTVDYLGENAIVNKINKNTKALSRKNSTLLFSSNEYYSKTNNGKGNAKGKKKGHDKHNNNNNKPSKYIDDFVIYWEMGTQNGNMKKKSIYQQKLRKGSYSLNIKLSVSENL
jgi:hypothetical protein